MEKVETISGLALVKASKRARQLGLDRYLDQDTERLVDLAGVNVLRLRLPTTTAGDHPATKTSGAA